MRARQIIMNGLTNAVKYSNPRENGPIRIVVHVEPGSIAGGDGHRGGSAHTVSGVDGRHAAYSFLSVSAPVAMDVEVPGVSNQLLCIDVLDCGPGLGGVDEALLFSDFAAPVPLGTATVQASSHGGSNEFHVGSSGVGLPICSRYVRVLFLAIRASRLLLAVRRRAFSRSSQACSAARR